MYWFLRISSAILVASAFFTSTQLCAEPAPDFPAYWLNSSPLTVQGLKGKLVVLFFYEEDCPKCRGMWPERLKTVEQFQDKPVVFIAVNSGTPAAEVVQYLREVNITWPTIVDTDRSFEKQCGVNEINLRNILACKVITPQGELVQGSSSDLKGMIAKYESEMKWRVDPSEISTALKPIWRSIEVGNNSTAIKSLNQLRGKNMTDAEKATVAKLNSTILDDFNAISERGNKLTTDGEKWKGFKLLIEAQQTFHGLSEAKKLNPAINNLRSDKEILHQLQAIKKFQENTKLLSSGNTASHAKGLKGMQLLVRDFSDTEAGQRARQSLEETEKTPTSK